MSSDTWNFKHQNNSIYVENISKTKVLAQSEIDDTVILEDFNENKKEQLWTKGEPNEEGYFTLKKSRYHRDYAITAVSSNSIIVTCKIILGKIIN